MSRNEEYQSMSAEDFSNLNKQDKGLCNIEKNGNNIKNIKCSGYRINKKEDTYFKAMAATEFATPDFKILLSLYTTENDQKYDSSREDRLRYLTRINFLEEFINGHVMDMKGYYSVVNPSTDQEIKNQTFKITPSGEILNRNKGLAVKVNKTNLLYLKNNGINIIVLHAAGGENLVNIYKRNGMVHFPNSKYIMFDGMYKFYKTDYSESDNLEIGTMNIDNDSIRGYIDTIIKKELIRVSHLDPAFQGEEV